MRKARSSHVIGVTEGGYRLERFLFQFFGFCTALRVFAGVVPFAAALPGQGFGAAGSRVVDDVSRAFGVRCWILAEQAVRTLTVAIAPRTQISLVLQGWRSGLPGFDFGGADAARTLPERRDGSLG